MEVAAVLNLVAFAYAGMEPGPASLNHDTLVDSLGAAWFLGWLAWGVGCANAEAFARRACMALAMFFMLSRPLLVQQGGQALYRVKAGGRNAVAC